MHGFHLVGLFGEVVEPLGGGIRLEKDGLLESGLDVYSLVSGSLCLLTLEKCEHVREPGCMQHVFPT